LASLMEWLRNKIFKRYSVFDFNIIGLNSTDVIADDALKNMEILKQTFINDIAELQRKRTKLYDDYFEKKWSLQLMFDNKRVLMNEILQKILELHDLAKEKKFYKNDYREFKQQLLKLLFKLIASVEDFNDLDHAISVLENAELIPKESKRDIIRVSPLGRWY